MSFLQECVDKLETEGYCRLPQVYSKSEVSDALEKVKWWYDHSKDSQSDNVPFLNIGQPTVYNLQNKDHFFSEDVI